MFPLKEFPNIRQHDIMQCGIACMAMVCKHHGKRYSLRFLEKLCAPTREGISLRALYELAEMIGFESQAGKLVTQNLTDCPLPAILHWDNKHFVVLYKIKDGKYYISNPARGRRSMNGDEFDSHWLSKGDGEDRKGIALFLEPTSDFGKMNDPTLQGEMTWNPLFKHLKDHRAMFLKIFICLSVVSGVQLVFPFLTQSIVDVGIKKSDLNFIWLILLGEFMMVLGRMSANFIKNRLILTMSQSINIEMISNFFIKLLQLPMHFFDTKLFGDLFQRMGDHGRIQSFLAGDVLSITFSLISFIVFGIVLALYNIPIFAIFLLCSAIYTVWILFFLHKRRELDFELFDKQAVCQSKTVQFLTTVQEIKLQNCEERKTEEWREAQKKLFQIKHRIQDLNQIREGGSIFINECKNIIITFFQI